MTSVAYIIFCSGKKECTNSIRIDTDLSPEVIEVSPKVSYTCRECLPKVPRKHRGDETQFRKDVARSVQELFDEFGRPAGNRSVVSRSWNTEGDEFDPGADINQER